MQHLALRPGEGNLDATEPRAYMHKTHGRTRTHTPSTQAPYLLSVFLSLTHVQEIPDGLLRRWLSNMRT